jgi:uncharacterized membrane protein HdeD (DUF308 family)
MNTLLKNWKTTSAGITMIAGGIIHLGFQIKAGTADENSWTIAVAAIVGGVGLIAAGDASQSESVNTPPPTPIAPPPQNPT